MGKSLRVLHVIPSIDARYGGPSYAVQAMVKFQNRAGITADILTTCKTTNGRRNLAVEELVIKDCSGTRRWKIFEFSSLCGEYKLSLGLWFWLRREIKNYDILHIHSIFCFSTALAAILARNQGVPYVVRPLGQLYSWALKNRNWLIKKVYLALIENKTISFADAVHFTTQDELDRCWLATDRSKAYVLPLGVEQTEKVSRSIASMIYPALKQKKTLLFLSRVHPVKGLDLVLPWLAPVILKRPHWVFVIAGEAERMDYLDRLKQLVCRYGIKDRVVFAGHVTGEKKAALYALADLFLLPSHSENFGVAVVEAMALGIPALISDQVGVHREIANNQAGGVFKLEKKFFCDAVERLMDAACLRRTMSENAQRLVCEKFNWPRITDQQIKQYRKILDRIDQR